MSLVRLLVMVFLVGWCTSALADWPQFRGPQGNGVSPAQNLPDRWSEGSDVIRWKAALPGPGTSSPIVVGDRVLLTSYSGYAESVDEPGDMNDLMRHVLCFNRRDGALLWQTDVAPELPESKYEGGNNTWHGYSSSTPISDGKHVYVFLGRTGVFCFDMEGKQKWRTKVGDRVTGWGSATSPVLFEDLLIVNASVESASLVALDKQTGEQRWQVSGIKGVWNSPTLVPLPQGRTELVVSLPTRIQAFDPATGKELWHCDGIPDQGYVCPSIVAHEGTVYAIGGRKNTAIAVRAGGQGDVTETHVVWQKGVGSNVSSPVYYEGKLYWVHERQGILNCLDASNGEVLFQQRIEPRPGVVYASVVAADGKLYAPSQHNGVYVFAAAPEYELLAQNTLADDTSRANACLAIADGRIFFRTDSHLYCIGQ